jgi:Uma2 family endonuclease
MQIETIKKLFTVQEYRQMAVAGILGPEERTELIEGEVLKMSPIGHRHAMCVARATHLFTTALQGKVIVNVQNPLQLSHYSELQPDIVLLKHRSDFYNTRERIEAGDTLLVLEVSDTTLGYDRNIKLPLFAASGVAEVWIENLNDDELLVYRDPVSRVYSTSLTFRRGALVSLAAFPEIPIKVDDLLG